MLKYRHNTLYIHGRTAWSLEAWASGVPGSLTDLMKMPSGSPEELDKLKESESLLEQGIRLLF